MKNTARKDEAASAQDDRCGDIATDKVTAWYKRFGTTPAKIRRDIRKWFSTFVASTYRDAFIKLLQSEYNADFEAIRARLDKSDTDRWRWEHGECDIGWETITEALAGFDVVITTGRFPRGRSVARDASTATLTQLALVEKETSKADLTTLVALLAMSRTSWIDASRTTVDGDYTRAREAQRVCRVVKTRTGEKWSLSFNELERLRRQWEVSWLLFTDSLGHTLAWKLEGLTADGEN